MESVFIVTKVDNALYPDDRVIVDVFPNSKLASRWLMQLVNEDVLDNGFDVTIKSRYNADGEIEMSADLIKGEERVLITSTKKPVCNKV